ncbi:AlpA family transcriptional regulator [Brachybacterium endophyticum]|uniref:AlpA family transcriptional regulator n=1 Tax=Brachybacterium endophyticum TaxID=2182385 RepID=A0A2U2RGH9_9MICO|nr:AlpA family transcriptional regulator [Brachybacterium endophyticum]
MTTRFSPARAHHAFLTAREVASQIGLSESGVYRRRALGRDLPRALDLGEGSVRWRQTDVDAWIEAHLDPVAGDPN